MTPSTSGGSDRIGQGSTREEAARHRRRGDSALTRAAIVQAARRLFAERDIATVSIRDIAAAAGISHGMVQRYFGSREQLLETILRQEVTDFHDSQVPVRPQDLDQLRELLRQGWPRFRDFAVVVARAELAGLEPELLLDPLDETPSGRLADLIAAQQPANVTGPTTDARLASAYVTAALFAFATMGPWLMVSVGMTEADLDARLDEVIDITLNVIRTLAEPHGH